MSILIVARLYPSLIINNMGYLGPRPLSIVHSIFDAYLNMPLTPVYIQDKYHVRTYGSAS
jgi:hypothetical protein